jgi:hypothetical protein
MVRSRPLIGVAWAILSLVAFAAAALCYGHTEFVCERTSLNRVDARLVVFYCFDRVSYNKIALVGAKYVDIDRNGTVSIWNGGEKQNDAFGFSADVPTYVQIGNFIATSIVGQKLRISTHVARLPSLLFALVGVLCCWALSRSCVATLHSSPNGTKGSSPPERKRSERTTELTPHRAPG